MKKDNWVTESKARQERLLDNLQRRIESIVPIQHQAELIQYVRDVSQMSYDIGKIEGKEFVLIELADLGEIK